MSMRSAVLVAAMLPLAACNSGPTVEAENATAGEVGAAIEAAGGAANFVSPGKWRSQVTIESLTMPGMPPEMAARMREQMAGQMTTESCLTQAEVEKPNAEFFGGKDDTCKYDRFAMGGGKIDILMTCGAGAARNTMAMQGTYSSDRYSMTANSQGGEDGVAMKMRVEAQRIGACDGTEED